MRARASTSCNQLYMQWSKIIWYTNNAYILQLFVQRWGLRLFNSEGRPKMILCCVYNNFLDMGPGTN